MVTPMVVTVWTAGDRQQWQGTQPPSGQRRVLCGRAVDVPGSRVGWGGKQPAGAEDLSECVWPGRRRDSDLVVSPRPPRPAGNVGGTGDWKWGTAPLSHLFLHKQDPGVGLPAF